MTAFWGGVCIAQHAILAARFSSFYSCPTKITDSPRTKEKLRRNKNFLELQHFEDWQISRAGLSKFARTQHLALLLLVIFAPVQYSPLSVSMVAGCWMQSAPIACFCIQPGPQHVASVSANVFLHPCANAALKSRLALGLLCFQRSFSFQKSNWL